MIGMDTSPASKRQIDTHQERVWRVRALDAALFTLALLIAAGTAHGVPALVDGTALTMGLILVVLFLLISHGLDLHYRAFFFRPAAARRQQLLAVAACVVLIATAGQILPFSPWSGFTPLFFAALVAPALLITRERLGERLHGWRRLPDAVRPVAVWSRGVDTALWLNELQHTLPPDWYPVVVIEDSMDLAQAEFEGLPVLSAGGDVLTRQLPRFGVRDVIIPSPNGADAIDASIIRTLQPLDLKLYIGTPAGLVEPATATA